MFYFPSLIPSTFIYMIKKYQVLFILILFLTACNTSVKTDQEQEEKPEEKPAYYTETYRPQYHFSPEKSWMNDPNGLVFNKGTYHLFYQYYPDSLAWGPMHWGHAASKDLVSWEHKPVALKPDSLGYIFSGSAVVDKNNTSGFGTTENPPMIAMFTYHDAKAADAGKTDYQSQAIAYSIDNGDTWTKYKGNPVVPNNDQGIDFRDPKIFWHEGSQKWILVLVAGDHAQIYNSDDLKKWDYLSEFGKKMGAHGGVWECPDLFPLKIDGNGEEKWVLLISINPGGPNGGSATQYFVGDFDGKTFTTAQKDIKWIDYGPDDYAGITYNNLPNDRRIFIGWMSNWFYGQKIPTSTWRSAMTLPRKLELHKTDDYFLSNYPIKNFTEKLNYLKLNVKNTEHFEDVGLNQSAIKFTQPSPLTDFRIAFSNTAKDSLFVDYNAEKKEFYIDRSKSGKTDFEPSFTSNKLVAKAQLKQGENVQFSIFLDQSSIEIFIDDGATTMTVRFFPNAPYTLFDFSGNAKPENLKIAHVPGIWSDNINTNKKQTQNQ